VERVLKNLKITDWLPVTREEMQKRGWDEADVIIVSGDAYVDHPSFGHAVIARILEQEGLRVAILPQPNWRDDLRDFRKLGKPRLFFGVTAGCMDSMVNHYTAFKRRRSDDAYTPGGMAGFRPDYASIVYSKILKDLFPGVPVILGGVEASLRRTTHYDYWSDSLKPGILEESGADVSVHGMGDLAIRHIARRMLMGDNIHELRDIPQICYMIDDAGEMPGHTSWETLELPSHEQCLKDKKAFATHFRLLEEDSNMLEQKRLIQKSNKRILVMNPAFPPLKSKDLDASFDLPYSRLPHPRYAKRGDVPAYEMIRFSINIHRGCFGGCSFCTISAHQGKFISSRSEPSIIKEVTQISLLPGFKGYITDLGGPSANMYRMKGRDESQCRNCKRPSCIYPKNCKNLITDHGPMNQLYGKVSELPGIHKVTIGSGIRYDMLVGHPANEDKRDHLTQYVRQLVTHHVSGRLKIAPEHTSDEVLKIMRKPSFKNFYAFHRLFTRFSEEAGLKQELIPYFISSHPGSTLMDMAELAAETKKTGFHLEQVQDFTPTPMTLSSVIYYCGFDPYTGKKIFTARSHDEKTAQNRFFFWYKKENRKWIADTLKNLGRNDLLMKLGGK
jgi:uncharacterized radical SAM protein YgiQ